MLSRIRPGALPRRRHMAQPILSFVAEDVGTDVTEYTEECVVYLIGFGTGDPEADGHSWTFSRSFDEDDGVCTVREIQRAVLHGGIERFTLHRSGVECVFDPEGARETGFGELRVRFTIDDKTWNDLVATAKIVFRDCPCFRLVE